ncbi:hypothetical protein [Sulfidibacter corallicola]|uniref:Uncharacterized protein n=1 Tax=Sulfidibacter corallicola TaxID=2818388 RepID=A0A8A4U128_SULCO|nr:hypothetical protein [Sulfidibacter corallicola]QTD52445.1 hypothetical protein J3U87_08235 [Sulfidibacter corallicola]
MAKMVAPMNHSSIFCGIGSGPVPSNHPRFPMEADILEKYGAKGRFFPMPPCSACPGGIFFRCANLSSMGDESRFGGQIIPPQSLRIRAKLWLGISNCLVLSGLCFWHRRCCSQVTEKRKGFGQTLESTSVVRGAIVCRTAFSCPFSSE